MESLNRKDLISVRSYLPSDRNFILATFLRGLYYGNDFFNQIPKNIFMENYHNLLERFLASPGVKIKVACLKDDPDVILGYCVSRTLKYGEADINIVDWIFVKAPWRGIGIGEMLLPKRVNACTHLTKVGQSIIKSKMPDVIFNPFLL